MYFLTDKQLKFVKIASTSYLGFGVRAKSNFPF